LLDLKWEEVDIEEKRLSLAGFKAVRSRAGMTGITWHTRRHTFASR